KYDHEPAPSKFAQSVVSMKADGSGVKIVASGIRQPFQLAFPNGAKNPYVTDLGQETKPAPPDMILIAKSGQGYRFPSCPLVSGKPCKGAPAPFAKLPPHASPMGIGAIGSTLYVSLFGGTGKGPEI